MATETEEIKMRVGMDTTAISKGMLEVKHQVREAFTELAKDVAAAFTVERLFEFGKGLVENARHIEETAQRLNLTTEAVQRLQHVAEMTGTTVDTLAQAFDKLAKTKEDALGGNTKEQDAFAQFGISLDELNRMEPAEIFSKISESIEKTGINAKVTAGLIELMGRSAGQLKPALE
jgi:hypothetical protein